MTIAIKSQTKEIEKGTLRIEKRLDKYSQVPYYIGTFQRKNFEIAPLILKWLRNWTQKPIHIKNF